MLENKTLFSSDELRECKLLLKEAANENGDSISGLNIISIENSREILGDFLHNIIKEASVIPFIAFSDCYLYLPWSTIDEYDAGTIRTACVHCTKRREKYSTANKEKCNEKEMLNLQLNAACY